MGYRRAGKMEVLRAARVPPGPTETSPLRKILCSVNVVESGLKSVRGSASPIATSTNLSFLITMKRHRLK